MMGSAASNGDGVSDDLLAHLRDEGSHSSNFVDEVLDTPGIGGRYGGADGRTALIAIMHSLIVLTGSEAAAVKWLFQSRGYTATTGNDARLALENGDFWSLTIMQDWLQILATHRRTCPVLIDTIFGGSVS